MDKTQRALRPLLICFAIVGATNSAVAQNVDCCDLMNFACFYNIPPQLCALWSQHVPPAFPVPLGSCSNLNCVDACGVGYKVLNCYDGDPCTDDTCENNGCPHPPVQQSMPCDDDDNPCTDDLCISGQCEHPPVQGFPSCHFDDNLCTDDSCFRGECVPFNIVCLDDHNPCTDDICRTEDGRCGRPNTDSCNDGNVCTINDTCSGGTCSGTPYDCRDTVFCNGRESCVPGEGCVAGEPENCDDGNPCNGLEPPCQELLPHCRPGTPCPPDDGNQCNGFERCDQVRGCFTLPRPDCEDPNLCTIDYCDPVAGRCEHEPLICTNHQPYCDGSIYYNGQETCEVDRGCVPLIAPVQCNDGQLCNGIETCNPNDGCHPEPPPRCTDDNFCNGIETCNQNDPRHDARGCVPGTPVVCNDHVICTEDFCDSEAGGCDYEYHDEVCDDGDPCTVDRCSHRCGCFSVPTPNCDGHLDDDDYQNFWAQFTGPVGPGRCPGPLGSSGTAPADDSAAELCATYDIYCDGDVDLEDFAFFQVMFTGP